MRTVWKYPLILSYIVTLEMPADTVPLCVQPQGDDVCLWALVDPHAENEKRYFRIVGTGYDLNFDHAAYIDTFQTLDLVFHVFEVKP